MCGIVEVWKCGSDGSKDEGQTVQLWESPKGWALQDAWEGMLFVMWTKQQFESLGRVRAQELQ